MNIVEKTLCGLEKDVLVVPEIGINHNGSLEVAKEMVLSAKRAGAKLIKHQTHVCEDEMCSAARNVIPGNADISIYNIMENAALSEDEEFELKRYTEELGLMFLSTPFSRAAADRLEKFGVGAYKIGSGELNNYPLIEHIAEFGKPMIISTGMNDLRAIEKTVNIVEKYSVKYALMHTTNLYPTKPEQVRLGAMLELMEAFKGVPVGLSDHTVNNNACIAAMGLGAKIVERHYTDRMDRVGPDIVCSMDENALKELLLAAEEVPYMLGGHKVALKEEQVTIDFAYASVVTIKPIKKGELFTKYNLWVKRPGTGDFLAESYERLLGKKAACDIEADEQLRKNMVE
ncbi:MAG: N-acetylneuraminate synthase family protein [Butyrivibrio sp.]|nr:N-acetylneuraminate synthase family protein [Butyrivibrio sp.]